MRSLLGWIKHININWLVYSPNLNKSESDELVLVDHSQYQSYTISMVLKNVRFP